MTPAQRAAALDRFRARLAALPPPAPERVDRIAALFAAIRLRMVRDKARVSRGVQLVGSDQPFIVYRDFTGARSEADKQGGKSA